MTVQCAFFGAALAFVLAVGHVRAETAAAAAPVAESANHWHEASLDEYRKHLADLTTIVEACARARDLKACDPTLVGPDDRVPITAGNGAERRLIRYGWLRVLLSRAEDKDEPEPKPVTVTEASPRKEEIPPARRTTSELLKDAEMRLVADQAQANGASVAIPSHSEEREAMKQVLAGRDFRGLMEHPRRDAALERINNWLNRLFEGVAKLRPRSAWVGRIIVWGFILAVCVGLVWGLIQLERRGRIRLVPEVDPPAAGAASARDWQLYLEDARKAAAEGQWREAIHFVYWASISRLEARRLWPADRARTPREYLALVAAEDPRRPGLARLTGSFERIWYGGRPAAEDDYRQAEELASGLISGSGMSGAAEGLAK